MDFTFTSEQQDIREMAHSFAEHSIRPVAAKYDREATFPDDVIKAAWEAGLMNTAVPEAYGGAGADALAATLISEELGWGCAGIATSIECNALASAPILLGGSEEIKKEYLGRLT